MNRYGQIAVAALAIIALACAGCSETANPTSTTPGLAVTLQPLAWQRVLSGTGDVWSLATTPAGVVFAATAGGMYRSLDAGGTWTRIDPLVTASVQRDRKWATVARNLAVDSCARQWVSATITSPETQK